ncbi:MAG: trypsin-like peptidase domain-containing protein [Patescibacteria group bacterium]
MKKSWTMWMLLVLSIFSVTCVSTPADEQNANPQTGLQTQTQLSEAEKIYEDFKFASVDVTTIMITEKGKAVTGGAGCFINKEGLVITACHVVKENDDEIATIFGKIKILSYEYEVTLKEKGKKYKAELVGYNFENDGALLRVKGIKPEEYTAAKLGDSDKLRVGQKIYVIGMPYGLSNSITDGIVSQLHRHIDTFYVEDWIQISAPVNPGNSGGVLVDQEGKIVGIINLKIMSADGIAFSLPINLLNVPQLMAGEVKRGKLGIECLVDNFPRMGSYQKPSLEDLIYLHEQTGINDVEILNRICKETEKQYAVVMTLEKDSSADRAGIKKGDIILSVDRKTIRNGMELRIALLNKNGKTLEINLMRVERQDSTKEDSEVILKPMTVSIVIGDKKNETKKILEY